MTRAPPSLAKAMGGSGPPDPPFWRACTFDMVPDLFCQLYIIHNNRVYADLYCLLPDKKTETYTRMFTLIMQSTCYVK